jgi:UV DNA damage endonuclease
VINIHGGDAYGEKSVALDRLRRNADRLSQLTLENDDRIYMPAELIPICKSVGIALLYDVHHHRCLPDGLNIAETAAAAIGTRNREPMFHVSNPRDGRQDRCPQYHAGFIDPAEFPDCWRSLAATVEVEAKANQHAVSKLRLALHRRKFMTWKPSVQIAS